MEGVGVALAAVLLFFFFLPLLWLVIWAYSAGSKNAVNPEINPSREECSREEGLETEKNEIDSHEEVILDSENTLDILTLACLERKRIEKERIANPKPVVKAFKTEPRAKSYVTPMIKRRKKAGSLIACLSYRY